MAPRMEGWQAALDRIPGLDPAAGLRTVAGREESLVRLLRRFEALHARDGARVAACLAEGRPGEAQALAHTLRGAAGFLGLVEIQASAADLEGALRDGTDGDPGPLGGRLDRALAGACAAIRDGLAE